MLDNLILLNSKVIVVITIIITILQLTFAPTAKSRDIDCTFIRAVNKNRNFICDTDDKLRFLALIEQPVELSTIIHLIATAARMFTFHISLSLTFQIFLPFRSWLVCASSALAMKKEKEKIEGILVKMSENDSYSGRAGAGAASYRNVAALEIVRK